MTSEGAKSSEESPVWLSSPYRIAIARLSFGGHLLSRPERLSRSRAADEAVPERRVELRDRFPGALEYLPARAEQQRARSDTVRFEGRGELSYCYYLSGAERSEADYGRIAVIYSAASGIVGFWKFQTGGGSGRK